MSRKRILFQGSYSSRSRTDSKGQRVRPEDLSTAEPIAAELGYKLIQGGFDLLLTGSRTLDGIAGRSAVNACEELGVDPRERIRTYPHGNEAAGGGIGMVLEPMERRWQEVRTFVVSEADALVALIGGKGTSDCIQKAVLAGKPVFPIAVAGGAAQAEWEKLKQSGFTNRDRGDLDFLADTSLDATSMSRLVVTSCAAVLQDDDRRYSNRIFLIHGHDVALRTELALFLERLELQPIILHEQPDEGRTILSKLATELSDVGYAFALLTPDDLGASIKAPDGTRNRARQNVIFEHGMLIGLLGPNRVCAIVRGDLEIPSDLAGVIYKQLGADDSISSIALELVRELKAAGYEVDANRL